MVARGEVAWLELEQEGRRPVVVLTRDEAIPRLRNIVVALVTRTIRGIDTEVQIGPADGMPVECAISLDNLRTVPRSLLTEPITDSTPHESTRSAGRYRVRSTVERSRAHPRSVAEALACCAPAAGRKRSSAPNALSARLVARRHGQNARPVRGASRRSGRRVTRSLASKVARCLLEQRGRWAGCGRHYEPG